MISTNCKDSSLWSRSPFIFQLGRDFNNFAQQVSYLLEEGREFDTESQNIGEWADLIVKDLPEFYMQPNQGNTSVGGNDAINCYWQFCADDDIIHPLTLLGDGSDGFGRVYSEVYDKHQQLLHLTMGVPQFSSLEEFYSTMIDSDLVALNNDASTINGIARTIGKLFGTVVKGVAAVTLAFAFPIIPVMYVANLVVDGIASAINTDKITKYYDFKSTMPLYYRYVDGILAHLAVNLGLFPDGTGGSTNGEVNQNYKSLFNGDESESRGIPSFLKKGPSMFRILAKRELRANPHSSLQNLDYEDYIGQPDTEDSWFAGFLPRLKASMFGADKFISFRIEKSTDSNESLSNGTGESAMAGMINGFVSQQKDASFTIANGKILENSVLGTGLSALKSVLQGLLSSIGVADTAANLFTGGGYADIPEVWQNSTFTKSYSFSMTLRSPNGDPVSIMQSIYVPLACLLAAALPRTVGRNAYTSPFLIRAYCKGMFAIPLGIIDSISITRGASEFGWSSSQLPTVVEVSFTIKDLSPVMHMAAPSGDAELLQVFGQNSSFQEYLLTLSGIGLNERLLWYQNVRRRARVSCMILRNKYFSPMWWSTSLGTTAVASIISVITPWSEYGNR